MPGWKCLEAVEVDFRYFQGLPASCGSPILLYAGTLRVHFRPSTFW